MNKIKKCVIVALMATSLVNGYDYTFSKLPQSFAEAAAAPVAPVVEEPTKEESPQVESQPAVVKEVEAEQPKEVVAEQPKEEPAVKEHHTSQHAVSNATESQHAEKHLSKAEQETEIMKKELEAEFDKLAMELVKSQLEINAKWDKLRLTMATEAKKFNMTMDIIKNQIELSKSWDKLYKEEEAAWNKWHKMNMNQKLAGLIDAFKQPDAAKEIWGDKASVESSAMGNITLHVDTLNSMVGVYADEVDSKGRPILQWEMNTKSGHVVETTRSKDGQQINVVEKDTNIGPRHSKFTAEHAQLEQLTNVDAPTKNDIVIDISEEMQDIENQRNIAFQIMFFFISFMLCAFGVTYVIFRRIETNRYLDAVKEGVKNQRVVNHQDFQQRSFVDFYVDQLSNDSMVINPYLHMTGPVTVDQSKKPSAKIQVQKERENEAYSQNDFSNIDQRGLFDDV